MNALSLPRNHPCTENISENYLELRKLSVKVIEEVCVRVQIILLLCISPRLAFILLTTAPTLLPTAYPRSWNATEASARTRLAPATYTCPRWRRGHCQRTSGARCTPRRTTRTCTTNTFDSLVARSLEADNKIALKSNVITI
jgi:hypothetical protein